MVFWTYMLHCRGGVFYTGHTDDIDRRIAEHQTGALPCFTTEYLPVELVWSQDFGTREEAIRAERQIKGWARRKKLALIRGDWAEISRLAKGKSGPSTSSGRTEVGLRIASAAISGIMDHAARAAPEECCGILLGHGGFIENALPAPNVASNPRRRFEIDPQALVDAHRAARAGGAPVLGYYHSHPVGRAEPSATDRAQAAHDGSVWAITGEGGITFWRDEETGFVPLSYAVVER
jgi:predicted GIY-YIG superfamily endonuclease/proteasome lid subunit RPN8/RPN11